MIPVLLEDPRPDHNEIDGPIVQGKIWNAVGPRLHLRWELVFGAYDEHLAGAGFQELLDPIDR